MNGFTYHDGKLEDVYSIKDELGRGQFAVVKRCIHQADETEVAAKFIKVKRTRTSKNGLNRELIEREASILQSINHEKIIKLYDVFDLGIEIVLVLELLSGGELFDKICELEYLTEVDACCYLKQVLLAIDHLHDSSIVHLDIKPENIVLKSNDSTDIKLVDFGLAQKLRPGEELKEMMGTPEFVAPEVINYEKIGLYTDMWAIGVLAYILLSGCSPFLGDDNQETYENIIKVDYHFDEEYFDKISIDAKQFVSELLVKAPHKRNTAKDCLDHPWIMTMSQPRSRFDSSIIVTTRFKAFVARRRWQQSFQKLNAITRFSKLMKKGGSLPTFNEELKFPERTNISNAPVDENNCTNSLISQNSTAPLTNNTDVNRVCTCTELTSIKTRRTPSISLADVVAVRKVLHSFEQKRLNKRKIKQYLSFDNLDDEDIDVKERDVSDESFNDSDVSDVDTDEHIVIEEKHIHNTLELWQQKEATGGRRKGKIKKIQREKKVVSQRAISSESSLDNDDTNDEVFYKDSDFDQSSDLQCEESGTMINGYSTTEQFTSGKSIQSSVNEDACTSESIEKCKNLVNKNVVTTKDVAVTNNVSSKDNVTTVLINCNRYRQIDNSTDINFDINANDMKNFNGIDVKKNNVYASWNTHQVENTNRSSTPIKNAPKRAEPRIASSPIKSQAQIKLLLLDEGPSNVKSYGSRQSSVSNGYEILEIVDKCENYEIQTVQESGAIETEYIDRVYVTSLCETIDLEEYLLNKNKSEFTDTMEDVKPHSNIMRHLSTRSNASELDLDNVDLRTDVSFNRSFSTSSDKQESDIYGGFVVIELDGGKVVWKDQNASGVLINDVSPGVSPCSSPPSQNTIDDTESKSDDEKNDKLNDDDVDKNVVNCDTTDGKSSDITENRLANQERMEIDTDNDINISTNISLTENKHTVINSNNHTIDDVPEIKITSNNIDSHVNGHNRSDRVSDEPQLIVSHVHPNRKYSREAPVHYTQMMRDAILLEKEKELALRKTEQQVHEDSEEDDTIDEKKKLIDDEVKTDLKKEEQKEVEEDKLSKKHTSQGDCAEGIKTNDVVIETVSTSGDCDFGEVKAFDIRESKVCRISTRKKAVFVDHKSMLNDESIRKPVRSASLDEQRRKFILGERPRPHSVDSAVLLDEKNKKEVEKLPSVSEDDSKGDVFEEVNGEVNNAVEPTQTLSFEMTENPTLSGTGVLPLDVNKNSSTEETLDMNENKENNNCVKDTMKSKHPQIETDDVKENSKNVKKKKSCTCRKRCSLM